jgi:hypothetical protein
MKSKFKLENMSTNRDNIRTITIPEKEYNSLVAKSKGGWKKYFDLKKFMIDEFMRLQSRLNQAQEALQRYEQNNQNQNIQIVERVRTIIQVESENEDLSFLKKQYMDMYLQINRLIQCPICLENYNLENIDNVELLNCGHSLCKGCKTNLRTKLCPCCRRKI